MVGGRTLRGAALRALPLGVKVKIIEPGGVRTDFSDRSFVFTNDPELEGYQPLVEAFLSASGSPAGLMEPEDVAAVIWAAVTDDTTRLRYIAGDGARAVLAERCSPEQDEAFVTGLRARFGL